MAHLIAYLDPGSGSLIFQALVGAVLAVVYFARSGLTQLIRKVRHNKRTRETSEEPSDAE